MILLRTRTMSRNFMHIPFVWISFFHKTIGVYFCRASLLGFLFFIVALWKLLIFWRSLPKILVFQEFSVSKIRFKNNGNFLAIWFGQIVCFTYGKSWINYGSHSIYTLITLYECKYEWVPTTKILLLAFNFVDKVV